MGTGARAKSWCLRIHEGASLPLCRAESKLSVRPCTGDMSLYSNIWGQDYDNRLQAVRALTLAFLFLGGDTLAALITAFQMHVLCKRLLWKRLMVMLVEFYTVEAGFSATCFLSRVSLCDEASVIYWALIRGALRLLTLLLSGCCGGASHPSALQLDVSHSVPGTPPSIAPQSVEPRRKSV